MPARATERPRNTRMSPTRTRPLRDGYLVTFQRPVAFAVSVGVTLAGLSVLTRVPMPAAGRSADANDALQVVWIERQRDDASGDRSPVQTRPGHSTLRRRASARMVPRLASPVSSTASASTPASAQSSTPKSAPESVLESRPALDLRLPESAFAPASASHAPPWQRPSPESFERKPLLAVRVEDRSLGGRLARAARGMECAELRAALRKPSASTEVIVESMRKRGCR
jgi:hypothetical protein